MSTFDICYSLDSLYVEQLEASIASILKNSDIDDNLNFYILDGGLTQEDKYEIELLKNIKTFNVEYISVNKKDFSNCPLLKEKDKKHKDYHVTLPTYFRFKLAELLPNLDKVLYLDCDVLVRSSFKELFNTNLKNYAAAMVKDAESKQEAVRLKIKKYFNAGVILINLDYWRKNNIEEKLFDYAQNNQENILWQDQDIINVVLTGKIKELPIIWNFQYFLYEEVDNSILSDCKILHLAGRFKPWLMPFEHNIYDYYYYYLAFTSKKNRIIEYKQNSSGKFLKDNIGGRTTNILVRATNDDVQKVYDEVSKVYAYTKEQADLGIKETYEKISKVYDAISSTYKYTDEKLTDVYKNIENSNEFTENTISETKTEIEKNTDVKLTKIYEELDKNYEYTKNIVSETQVNNEKTTDEKLSKVYDEITANYNYTNEIVKTSKEENKNYISSVSNGLEEKIITESAKTDSKISAVYDEISKNYDYTNKLSEEVKAELNSLNENTENLLNQKIQETNQKVDNNVTEIYEAISKTYDFTKETVSEKELTIENNTNDKISKLYGELTNNYEFTKNLALETETKVEQNTDEKLSKVYEEISKNYEYTNQLSENSQQEINNKYESLSNQLIDNSNDIKNLVDEKVIDLSNNTDNKISGIYSEINTIKNETADNCNKLSEKIDNQKLNITAETDTKISKVYDEITKNYEYTNKLNEENKQEILSVKQYNEDILDKNKKEAVLSIENLSNKTDSNFAEVKNDIQQNKNEIFEKINNEVINQASLNAALQKNIEQTNEQINTYKQDCIDRIEAVQTEAIQRFEQVQDEIVKNASFTEFLVQSVEEKQNQNRIDTLNNVSAAINNLRNESNEKLNSVADNINSAANAKYNEIYNEINNRVNNLSEQINKETNIKFSELYAYTNEQVSNLYKEVKNTSLMIENSLKTQIWDLYKRNEELSNEINYLKNELSQRPDDKMLQTIINELKQDISNRDSIYSENLLMLKNEFIEEINQQRIKYENKLSAMDNQIEKMDSIISELQKNLFKKIIDKMKKSKKDN